MPNSNAPSQQNGSLACLGYGLGGISLIAFFALLHHPVAIGHDPAAIFASIQAQTGMDQIVHSALAGIFGLLTAAMVLFAVRLGLWRYSVMCGLIAFFCAFVLTVLAAMTDGFVVPGIAARCAAPALGSCVSESLALMRLSSLQIEFLTRFSFAGIALAGLAWSWALFATPGIPRWAGFIGLASGLCQIAALSLASSHLVRASLLEIFAAQLTWFLLIAILMILQQGPFAAAEQA